MRSTRAPAAITLAAIQAELVSTVRPLTSSRPTARISTGVPDSNDIRREAAALARDRTSGATLLARRAARLLGVAARDDGKSLTGWQQDLHAASALVAAAQPAMASLLTVVDVALCAAEGARSAAEGAAAVRRALRDHRARQPVALAAAAARAAGLLPPRALCLTLSSSEAVFRTLVTARRLGRLGAVVVAESRPGLEGVALARRLGARRIPVTVIVDAAAPAAVGSVSAVVVGADAVTPEGVWNKCGTLGVSLAARAARCRVYVVTTEDRLVPRSLACCLRVPEAQPTAVLRARPPGVRAVNRLFDVTPLGLVTRIVTERGVLPPAAVRRRLGRRRVARWWVSERPRRGCA